MSDLDRAIDARIDAYTPSRPPPFAVLARRRRRRNSRLAAVGGAAVVGLIGAAVLASSSLSDRSTLPERLAGSAENPGTTFALRPVGFQNEQADLYQAAAERCRDLPGVTGGPVNESFPATYSLAAAGADASRLRSCLADIGASVEEIEGRPGERRGRAEAVERCVRGEADAEQRYIGLTESQLQQTEPGPVRVICRDRVVLGRTSDNRPERLNIVVENGTIIWAGRF